MLKQVYLVRNSFFESYEIIYWDFFLINQLYGNSQICLIYIEIFLGCEFPSWYTDGYCDDANNNEACFFDGGDCCGSNANTQFCTECLCLEEGGEGSGETTTPSGATTSGSCNQDWIADGFCDDINNNLACTYDGGDCCGPNVNVQYCDECQMCLHLGWINLEMSIQCYTID